jgi:RNA polymerase sigma-70 factor (ECF subfamily)
LIFSKRQRKKAHFSVWIKQYHAALYKHALWMTGNQDLASDMVQEAYFQAWSNVDTLQDMSKALPWLLTILRRVIYREQRFEYRHRETMVQLHELQSDASPGEESAMLDAYHCLERISPVQREALLLNVLHGFTYEQIGEQLEIPVGTVMSRISRAKEALRNIHEAETANIVHLDQARKRETQ